jgi:large subunit ribosomal protein L9
MLVILKEDINHLGRIGDVVKVSDGYARNFLLPKKLVLRANEGDIAQIEHHKKSLEKKRQEARSAAEAIASKLGSFTCTFKRKAGKGDKMFGSVSTAEIADELKKAGYDLGRAAVQLKEPIKALGIHSVSVRVAPEVSATIRVVVAKDEEGASSEAKS